MDAKLCQKLIKILYWGFLTPNALILCTTRGIPRTPELQATNSKNSKEYSYSAWTFECLEKKLKNESRRERQSMKVLMISYTNSFRRVYLVCALLTTVSAWYMLKKSKVQKKDVRSVSPLFTLPTQHWTYLPYSSFRHVLPEWYLGRCFKSDKISPTYVAKWPYYCSCSAKRSPHEAKREHVGEERTKPVSPTHLSAQQPKRTPLLPYLKRCQGLVPCQKQAHFHRQSQEIFWQGRATLLFLDRAFSAQTFCVQIWETWQ